MTLFDDVPKLLRWLRARAERDQSEAATFLGVSGAAISRWETGRSPIPLDAFDRLLVLYGIASLTQLDEEIRAMRTGAAVAPRPAVPAELPLSKEELVEFLLDYARMKREEGRRAAPTESASPKKEPEG